MTPRSRHAQKRAVAVAFLGVFGVSVNPLLIRALGVRSDSFPRLLVRQGVLAEHRIVGYPNKLYTLTRAGHSIAEMLLQRNVRLIRGDKLTTSQLAHDLMTQAAVLKSLETMAERGSAALDLSAFLVHARDAKDLGAIDQAVRPDLLFCFNGRALSWELENNPKSSKALHSKMHTLLRTSARFTKLTVFWVIRGGPDVIERYRRVFENVLDEAHRLDGISKSELSRVTCTFSAAEPIVGIR